MLLFSVATGMLVKCGFGNLCKKIAKKPFKALFSLDGSLCAAFILGAIGGFPLGAKTVCELYREDECPKDDAERALALCSNPGLGFTVAGIGEAMLGNTAIGLKMWLSCLAASVIIAILSTRNNAANPPKTPKNSEKNDAETISQKPPVSSTEKRSNAQIVTDSISDSSLSLVKICAFVVIFKTLSSIFLGITASLPITGYLSAPLPAALIACVFEFSSGIQTLIKAFLTPVALSLPYIKTVQPLHLLITATLAWSGVSVHMQTSAFTASNGLKLKNYYLQKLSSTLLSPLCFLAISYIELLFKALI